MMSALSRKVCSVRPSRPRRCCRRKKRSSRARRPRRSAATSGCDPALITLTGSISVIPPPKVRVSPAVPRRAFHPWFQGERFPSGSKVRKSADSYEEAQQFHVLARDETPLSVPRPPLLHAEETVAHRQAPPLQPLRQEDRAEDPGRPPRVIRRGDHDRPPQPGCSHAALAGPGGVHE